MYGLMQAISLLEGYRNDLLSMGPICIKFEKRNDALVLTVLFKKERPCNDYHSIRLRSAS